MAMLPPRRSPNVFIGLLLFWCGILSIFFWIDGFNFEFMLPWAISLSFGIWLANWSTNAYRRNILDRLKYHAKLSMPKEFPLESLTSFGDTRAFITSSLGPVPFTQSPLLRLDEFSFEKFKAQRPPELQADGLLENFYHRFLNEQYENKYPGHIQLFIAIACCLLHPQNLKTPAGIDRHHGRSLLQHTMLVSSLMIQRAPAYLYNPHGFDPINPDFRLDPLDPLILLLGMAHDLGKVRDMTYDAEEKTMTLAPAHHLTSLREISRMPEFWDEELPSEDRILLQMALAYSGNMAGTPIQSNPGGDKNNKALVTSDRLHALMGLLGESDRLASSIEMGLSYDFTVWPKATVSYALNSADAISPENLLSTLQTYMLKHMSLNTQSDGVGFKVNDAVFSRGRHIVLIDELRFSHAFAAYLERPELAEREGKSNALTKRILEALDDSRYLYRIPEEEGAKPRPATSCLYKIEWHNPFEEPGEEAMQGIASCFIVDVTEWGGMEVLREQPGYPFMPALVGFRIGRQSKVQKIEVIKASSDENILVKSGSHLESTKPINPQQIRLEIAKALSRKRITPALIDDEIIAVVSMPELYQEFGLQIPPTDPLPSDFEAIGILEIKPSQQQIGQYVMVLRRTLYDKYIIPTKRDT